MATARISATGLPIPQGGIGDILEGGRYIGPPRVFAGGSAGSGSNIIKGIISALTKDDVMTGEDLANIPVEEREAKKAEKKKQIRTVQGSRLAGMTAEEQRAAAERGDFGQLEMSKKKDNKKKTVTIDEEGNEIPDVPDQMPDPDKDPDERTIIFDDAQTIARKLIQEGAGKLVDKGIEKLEEKYFDLEEQKLKELEEGRPDDSFAKLGDDFESITQTPNKKGKIIDIGNETTEGTFRYNKKTYNKSDGVRVEYPTISPGKVTPTRQWIPKDVYGKPNVPPTENFKTRHVAETIDEINKIFPNQNLHEITGPAMLDILRQNGHDTTLSTIFTAKNKIMERGPTEEENRAKRILDPEGYEAEDLSFFSGALSRLDKEVYDQTKAFIKDVTPNKLEKNILNKHLGRMVKFAKREGKKEGLSDAEIDAEILEAINNVDKEKLKELLDGVGELRALNKQLRDLGINPIVQGKPYAINLSHKIPVKKDWRKSFDPDNLFVSDSYGNLILQPSLEKQIKDIKDGLKNFKTLTEKKEFLKQSMPGFEGDKARTIKEVRQAFKDNRLISIFGDKVFGSPNPDDPYFIKEIRDILTKRLETGKFKKGGIISMEEMIQPISLKYTS